MDSVSNEVVLDVRNLSVIYSSYGVEKKAVDSISFKLRKGEILGIVGESGAGKSTIAKAIMGIIDPPSYATGEVIFNGKNIIGMSEYKLNKIRWNKITMIFQASMNSLNPVESVKSNFMSVLKDKLDISEKGEAEMKIDEVLRYVSLPLYVKDNFPHELSGGMRQRILIALAMITGPEVVIADEPTTALDIITEFYVLSILKKNLKRSGSSMIYITHDLPSVIFLADEMLVMKNGLIVEKGPIKNIINNPQNEYTKKLVSTLNEVIE